MSWNIALSGRMPMSPDGSVPASRKSWSDYNECRKWRCYSYDSAKGIKSKGEKLKKREHDLTREWLPDPGPDDFAALIKQKCFEWYGIEGMVQNPPIDATMGDEQIADYVQTTGIPIPIVSLQHATIANPMSTIGYTQMLDQIAAGTAHTFILHSSLARGHYATLHTVNIGGAITLHIIDSLQGDGWHLEAELNGHIVAGHYGNIHTAYHPLGIQGGIGLNSCGPIAIAVAAHLNQNPTVNINVLPIVDITNHASAIVAEIGVNDIEPAPLEEPDLNYFGVILLALSVQSFFEAH
jgi:hypothetical protein